MFIMNKRGQVTLFVVMAIILVGGAFAIIYTQTDLFKKTETMNPEIAPIKTFIDNCLKSTAEDALIYIGHQGGYYDLPKLSIDTYSYYFYNNKSMVPSVQKIESELSRYMADMLPFCTQNFTNFTGFDINSNSKIVSKSIILSEKVRFDVDYPILIKKGASAYRLSSFSAEIPSRLFTIYRVAQNFTSVQLEDPLSLCVSCLTNLMINNDFYINMENYDNNTVIFTITDNQTLINQNSYEFIFANKYD